MKLLNKHAKIPLRWKQIILLTCVILMLIFAIEQLWNHNWIRGSIKLVLAILGIIIYSDIRCLEE